MKNIITDFGAIPGTDCTIPFQLAANSGETVLIPSNMYIISNTSTMIPNTKFIGEPGAIIQNVSPTNLFEIVGSNTDIQNIDFDDLSSTNKNIVIKSSLGFLENITLKNISSNRTKGLIYDENSNNKIRSLQIDNIRSSGTSGKVIYLDSYVDKCKISNVTINYINSSAPDNAGITVLKTGALDGNLTLTKVDIQGSDALGLPNQHGIIIGGGEHYSLDNINVLMAGGKGLWCQNTINFRVSNFNSSFCVGNQIQFDSCVYSTITNSMTRGRANGGLSFLVLSTYGLNLNGCTCINIDNSTFKSNGAGVWLNASNNTCISNSGFSINHYYGMVSTGNNSSITSGSAFYGNGVLNCIQSSGGQYVRNCLTSTGLKDFSGAGNF